MLIWREKSYLFQEDIAVFDILEKAKEISMFFSESVTIFDQSNMWRELSDYFMETIVVVDDMEEAKELLVIEFEEVTMETIQADDTMMIWREKTYTFQETTEVTDLLEALGEYTLAFFEVLESVEISDEAIFIGIPIIPYVPVIPIIDMIIVFVTAWFFTLGHIFERNKRLVWGIIAFGAWWIVGWLWLFIEPLSYFVALLFFGIGTIILITVLIGLFSNLKEKKQRERELG